VGGELRTKFGRKFKILPRDLAIGFATKRLESAIPEIAPFP
jgi:hypothetical protein